MRVTGLGSWPGTDFAAAQRLVLGELPDLPPLVELPARGPAAGPVGRGTAVLADLTADLQPGGWRLADHAGADQRRARTLLRDDLDRLEEQAQGYTGPLVVSVPGPWTMAASLDTPRGDKALGDPGARRDVGQALAAGVADLVAGLTRRLPAVEPVVVLDEPLLPAVLAGAVRTASGLQRFRRLDRPEVAGGLSEVRTALAGRTVVVHSSGGGADPSSDLPLVLGCDAGVAVPAAGLRAADLDTLAGALEQGAAVWLGVLPTGQEPGEAVGPDRLAERALAVLRPPDLDPELTTRVVLTPDGGLAGWSAVGALGALRALRTAADIVADRLRA